MLLKRAFWGGIAAFTSLTLAGCTGTRDTGSASYLIPTLDSNGQTLLEQVPLKTLSSPYRAEGAAARVYLEPGLAGNQFIGDPAQPHLARSGSTYIPLDAESGMVLSAYAFFEKMLNYENRVLVSNDLPWPRTIGIFRSAETKGIEENNAMYLGYPMDSYVLLPYTNKNRVALAFNYGVLGHEHFHAHFDRLVNRRLKELHGVTNLEQTFALYCPSTIFHYELLVLRQWNEGLADTYGALTSGMFDFMIESLAPQVSRDLTLPPVALQGRGEISRAMLSNMKAVQAKDCRGFNPYFNGEQIARTLLKIARNGDFPAVQEDGKTFTKYERAARYLIYRLGDLAPAVASRGWDSVQPDYILQFMLQKVKLSPSSCLALREAGSDMGGYPQCAGL